METKTLTIKTLERKINKVGTPIIIVNGKYKTIDNVRKLVKLIATSLLTKKRTSFALIAIRRQFIYEQILLSLWK